MAALEGKVALITGGASGIGLGIARVLAARGARLAIAYFDGTHIENARASLAEADVVFLHADIRIRGAVAQMVASAAEHFGAIDILVNNASLTGPPAVAAFLDCTEEQLDAIVDTNLKGTFHVSQAVARFMVAKGTAGSIVNVASVGAFAGQEFASAYCATKAGQAAMVQTLAIELAPFGIRVNAVAPGDIHTPANATITRDLACVGSSGKYLRATPLGRRGTPEEIGRAVAFLVSADASFVTGTTLVVDGGFLAY
ncbi:MAG: SDR family NAD(P)-dependent oxidoreductase [Bryobacteraceae bacterium]